MMMLSWLVGFFLVEGGEGAEKEVAGEGHDGGAGRCDPRPGKAVGGEGFIGRNGGLELKRTRDGHQVLCQSRPRGH